VTKSYDVLVIGSGPAGVEAALAARRSGSRVAILERGLFGGTCLNEGCVPSNALLEAVERASGEPLERLKAARATADQLVPHLRKGLRSSVHAAQIDVLGGEAVSVRSGQVMLGDGETLSADAIVVATGAETSVPDIPGADGPFCLTWADCLSLETVPARVAVVAGGPLALESVRLFCSLGSAVTYVASSEILVVDDQELMEFLYSELERLGVSVVASPVREVAAAASALVTFDGREPVEVDLVVWADFRTPRMNGPARLLGVDDDGWIASPDGVSTELPGVYVCGDVTGVPLLASSARHSGLVAGLAATGTPVRAAHSLIAVHGKPEVASAGLTEDQARREGRAVGIGYAEFSRSARSLALDEPHGVVKLVADTGTGAVIGGQVIGTNAAELVSLVMLAIDAEATAEMLAELTHAHPSLMELISDAARAALAA
jgi:dihydrolipoamide dehydrogenase